MHHTDTKTCTVFSVTGTCLAQLPHNGMQFRSTPAPLKKLTNVTTRLHKSPSAHLRAFAGFSSETAEQATLNAHTEPQPVR
jgi:hypothetical protein